ncbi:MAG TPA: hypothetical protein DDW78_01385 [Treponema sp.]|nr:hypothetical protein [Treponema sp.]
MRQFIAETEPDSSGCIVVEGKKCRYLSSVLRVEPGDMLYVRLPSGALQQMTVAMLAPGGHRIVLSVAGAVQEPDVVSCGAAPVASGPGCALWLFQFAAKPPKMDLIIRQAAECGVRAVVPVAGAFCQSGNVESARKKSSPGDERWGRIITEAREQSGSPVETEVLPCMTLDAACALWQERAASAPALVLYEQTKGTMPLHAAVAERFSAGSAEAAALMVGAEGGISPEELDCARAYGFVPVHFETNILRCETAALYGIAALQTALVEKNIWQYKK